MRELLWHTEEGRRRVEEIAAGEGGLAGAVARGHLVSIGRQAAAVVAGTLLVKWRTVRKGRKLRTFLRPSPERKEARALLKAAALGLGCPAPLLVAELRRGPLLVAALAVRPFLEGCSDGAARLLRDDVSQTMLEALRRWHDAGFRHGDCWPKNVLVSDDGSACVPIGFPRARFVAPGARADRRRVDDLARLAYGIASARAGSDPRAMVERYGVPGMWPAVKARIARLRARDAAPKGPSLPPRPLPFTPFRLWNAPTRPLPL